MALELFSRVRNKISEYGWICKENTQNPPSEDDELALGVQPRNNYVYYCFSITVGWPSGIPLYPITPKVKDATSPSRRLPSQTTLITALDKVESFAGETVLKIFLPDVALLYDDKLESPLPLNLFKDIRYLQWQGHRTQLCKSWCPISPLVSTSLTSLVICCEISLQDCAYILFHFDRLQMLRVQSIVKELSKEPTFPFDMRTIYVDRPELDCLILKSDDDIGPLFLHFTFPSLQRITCVLSYPTIGTFDGIDIWQNVRSADIRCYVTTEDGEWLQNSLPPQESWALPTPGFVWRSDSEEEDPSNDILF
ncbi:hypothetical protein H0H92_002439 [Tricholoma furcatifolium]|nr:hypothetical protein H0H92_002439 [Tricholoma furcatifolium]